MKKKKNKRKHNKTRKISYLTEKPELCLNCRKKKILYYYEEIIIFNNKNFIIYMCKDCLEEVKMKLLESPNKEHLEYSGKMINIINELLEEKK